MTIKRTLQRDLAALLNEYSRENLSDTPDYILAEFMLAALNAFEIGVNNRANWYRSSPAPWKENERSAGLERAAKAVAITTPDRVSLLEDVLKISELEERIVELEIWS